MPHRHGRSAFCNASTLLRRHRYFHGVGDLDEARELVGKLYCDHRMRLAERQPLNAWMNAVRPHRVTYSSIGYGAASTVEPGATGSFIPVMIPQSGDGEVWVGHEHVPIQPGKAAVVSATEPLRMRLSADCTLLILCLDLRALEDCASELLGEPVPGPVRFTVGMDVTQGRGARWCQRVLTDVADLGSPDSLLLRHDLSARSAEHQLMTSLLFTQPHNYTERIFADMDLTPSARIVRVVREYVDAHPDGRHTLPKLAKVAHCSVSTLHAAFKHHVRQAPMGYLKKHRLWMARRKLLRARRDGATVMDIAVSCGFTSTGAFARDYQRLFGETPSETTRA